MVLGLALYCRSNAFRFYIGFDTILYSRHTGHGFTRAPGSTPRALKGPVGPTEPKWSLMSVGLPLDDRADLDQFEADCLACGLRELSAG